MFGVRLTNRGEITNSGAPPSSAEGHTVTAAMAAAGSPAQKHEKRQKFRPRCWSAPRRRGGGRWLCWWSSGLPSGWRVARERRGDLAPAHAPRPAATKLGLLAAGFAPAALAMWAVGLPRLPGGRGEIGPCGYRDRKCRLILEGHAAPGWMVRGDSFELAGRGSARGVESGRRQGRGIERWRVIGWLAVRPGWREHTDEQVGHRRPCSGQN